LTNALSLSSEQSAEVSEPNKSEQPEDEGSTESIFEFALTSLAIIRVPGPRALLWLNSERRKMGERFQQLHVDFGPDAATCRRAAGAPDRLHQLCSPSRPPVETGAPTPPPLSQSLSSLIMNEPDGSRLVWPFVCLPGRVVWQISPRPIIQAVDMCVCARASAEMTSSEGTRHKESGCEMELNDRRRPKGRGWQQR
jgi:hypothetical protein